MKRTKRARRPGLDDPRYLTNRQHLKSTGNHICHVCSYPIDMQLVHPHPLSWSCDHRTPRARLQPDDIRHWHIDYLLEAHFRCNSSRGAKPLPTVEPPPHRPAIEW